MPKTQKVQPKPVQVKQVEGAAVATEVIAQAVVDIAAGMKKLRSGRLNEPAIVHLIYHACGRGVPEVTIRRVLAGMSSLEDQFIRKAKK